MIEVTRRAVLLAAITGGIFLVFLTRTTPVVVIESIDWSVVQDNYGGFLPDEDEKRLRQLPLEQFVAERSAGKVVTLDQALESLVDELPWVAGAFGRALCHVDARDARIALVIADRTLDDELYLLRSGSLLSDYRLRRQSPGEPGALGTSAWGYPEPPFSVRNPWWGWGLSCCAAGLLLYFVIPRRQLAGGWPSWKLALGDLAGLILFVPFLALPLLVSGGVRELAGPGVFLAVACWPLAALATWIHYWMAWFAASSICVDDGHIHVSGLGGETRLPLADVARFGPAAHLLPRWISGALAVGAAFSGGASSARLAGQSILAGQAAQGGIYLDMRDGQRAYLWGADPDGDAPRSEARDVLASLETSTAERGEPQVVRAFGLPRGVESPRPRGGARILATPWITLIVLMALAFATADAQSSSTGQPSDLDDKPTPAHSEER